MLEDVGHGRVDCLYTWRSHSLHYVWNENKRNPRT